MRSFRYIILLMFVSLSNLAKSQDIPPLNPEIDLNILSGNMIEFVFDEMSEYQYGIMNAGQITLIRVGCIYDWQLSFSSIDVMFYGDTDPSNEMLLNNVGLLIMSNGTNLDNGSNITNLAKSSPSALESNDELLLTKGSGSNKGYGVKNAFTLFWEMGTMRGTMNNISMLDQNLNSDTYTITILFTLSALP